MKGLPATGSSLRSRHIMLRREDSAKSEIMIKLSVNTERTAVNIDSKTNTNKPSNLAKLMIARLHFNINDYINT